MHHFFLPHNPTFVGREGELRRIARAIKAASAAAITTGIGGIGKSQLASEFTHRYGRYFAGGVFWISFAIPSTISSKFSACGSPVCLDLFQDSDDLTLDEQVAWVRQAFASDLPRLVIFDNCNNNEEVTGEGLLQRPRPTADGCGVLVTSCRQSWRGSAQLAIVGLPVPPRAKSVARWRSSTTGAAVASCPATSIWPRSC
jgi:hypothetical protein